jgi:hypothetical protein
LGGVLAGQVEGVGRDVGQGDLPAGFRSGEGKPEDTGAAAEVEHAGGFRKREVQQDFDEFLGLGPWDEGAGVGEELVSVEPDGAEEMLERNAFAALFQGLAKGDQIRLTDRLVEAQIELHPGAVELVGHQHLHVPPGVLDAALFKVARTAVEDFENRGHSWAARMDSRAETSKG